MTQPRPKPVPADESKNASRVMSRRQLLTVGVPVAAGVVVPLVMCGVTPLWEKLVDQVWPGEPEQPGPRMDPGPSSDAATTSPDATTSSPSAGVTGAAAEPVPRGWSQYVCIGVPVEQWQAEFDRVKDAGYALSFFDGYDVAGRSHVNAIFEPWDRVGWESRSNVTGSQFDALHAEMTERGYRLVTVQSYLRGGALRHSGIWRRERGPRQVFYRGLSRNEHQARVDELAADGYRPVAVSVAAPGGVPEWTGLYELDPDNRDWLLKSWLPLDEYDRQWDEAAAQGMYPTYLSAAHYRGETRISAIWDRDPEWRESRYNVNADRLAELVAVHRQSGHRLVAVAGYDSTAGSALYAASWSR